MYKRELFERLVKVCDYKKAIIIIGPRQVGKTTLVQELVNSLGIDVMEVNGDNSLDVDLWTPSNSRQVLSIIGDKKVVVIDEAQNFENIGLLLKIIIDKILGIQFIVTGSSALDIANRTNESLTGRKWTYELFPISVQELRSKENNMELLQNISERLVYGQYPEVLNNPERAVQILNELVNSYLYKDILSLAGIRKPTVLTRLVQVLAWQIGDQISYNNISRELGVDVKTIDAYVTLLEQAYIVFTLPSFSKNLRTELKQSKKIFFYDNGIRNAVIQQLQPLALRNDTGKLWENYCIAERRKKNAYAQTNTQSFFWRTTLQQEIDYIEVANDAMQATELKYNEAKKTKQGTAFTKAYPQAEVQTIHRLNFIEWI